MKEAATAKAAVRPEDGLPAKRLIGVLGKGGVGKSTVTAALALLAKQMGKRVIVVEIDTVPTVAALLGSTLEVGYQPREIVPGISIMNVSGPAAIEDYLSGWIKGRIVREKLFQSKIYQYFVSAAPGLKELMVVGKLWDLVDNQPGKDGRPRYDLVLADLPATGHGFSHLRMPQTAVSTLKIGFVKEEAAKVQRLFQDAARTAFIIVTLAEEMPVNEAVELRKMVVETLHFPVGGVFMNAVYPEVLDGQAQNLEQRERLSKAMTEMERTPELRPLFAGVSSVQKRRDMNRHYVELLQSLFQEPVVVLPFLFSRDFGPQAVEQLAQRIGAEMKQGRI